MRNSVEVDNDVLIVGGGAAGPYAAYRLQQANISFKLLEADDHVGGRVHSRPENYSHLGLVLDDGANLINSTDTLAIRLMNSFGITYVRRLKPSVDSMYYLQDGQLYDQSGMDRLLFRESRTAMNHMLNDQDVWHNDTERDFNPKFIDESIASYLARCEAGPALKAMLKSFF